MALGLLHGPTELLPISSSGHTTLIPWLLGSDYSELDPELRKALEVALHAGALAALLTDWRPQRDELGGRDILLLAIGSAPAGLAGLLLEQRVEDRLGTPGTIAVGLFVGGLALALADLRPQQRRAEDASGSDALWLGLAQAGALIPGVSRNGATLAAARFRRFRRRDASRLSRRLALPVITGATLLKAWRIIGQGRLAAQGPALAAGALASLGSTRLAARLIGARRDEQPLAAYALYRMSLAGLTLIRLDRRPPQLGQHAQDQGHAHST